MLTCVVVVCCCCQLCSILYSEKQTHLRSGLQVVGCEAAYTRQASSRTQPITQVRGSPVDTLSVLRIRPSRGEPRPACAPFSSQLQPTACKSPLHGTTADFAWRVRPRDSADLPRRSRLRTAVVCTKKSRLKRFSNDTRLNLPAALRTGAGAINCYTDRSRAVPRCA